MDKGKSAYLAIVLSVILLILLVWAFTSSWNRNSLTQVKSLSLFIIPSIVLMVISLFMKPGKYDFRIVLRWIGITLAILPILLSLPFLAVDLGISKPYERCITNPLTEIVSRTQSAESGIVTVTEKLCFSSPNERITIDSILLRLSSVESITCSCGGDVCSEGGNLIITDNAITTNNYAQFKIQIECDELDNGLYACDFIIIDP